MIKSRLDLAKQEAAKTVMLEKALLHQSHAKDKEELEAMFQEEQLKRAMQRNNNEESLLKKQLDSMACSHKAVLAEAQLNRRKAGPSAAPVLD